MSASVIGLRDAAGGCSSMAARMTVANARRVGMPIALACSLALVGCQTGSGESAAAPSAAVSTPVPASGTASNAAPNPASNGCATPMLADYAALTPIAKLPDPFKFIDGHRMSTVADWTCRRAEISAQAQKYELGTLPPAPARERRESRDQQLMVHVEHEGKAIDFAVNIKLPATGKGPYPAIIGMGMVSLNNDELSQQGIALISFPNGDIGEQLTSASRGKGKFYTLYGSDHTASAMTAWAWGVGRVIDALEKTPGAQIDTKHLGVTGCSRNGKGAIVAGAFDERIKLTIAQESGAGGAAGWRVSDAQLAAAPNVQTLHQIVDENVWFTDSFRQFGQTATRLPIDQHSVMSLIAPRALLVIENTSMEWLGNQSAYINASAAGQVWKALGIPTAMGLSQVGGHNHCQLPASQYADVNSFVKAYLLSDSNVPAQLLKTDGTFSTDLGAWVDWNTPALAK